MPTLDIRYKRGGGETIHYRTFNEAFREKSRLSDPSFKGIKSLTISRSPVHKRRKKTSMYGFNFNIPKFRF
jgi:hypothetical protein